MRERERGEGERERGEEERKRGGRDCHTYKYRNITTTSIL